MKAKTFFITAAIAGVLVVGAGARQQPTPPSAPQQPSEITATITSERGAQRKFAVPDFIALSPDRETQDAAKTIGRVLWDDLNYEHEFSMIPRDVYSTVPAARSLTDAPFDAWRQLGADAVVIGTVEKTAAGIRVQVRVVEPKSQGTAYSQEYSGSIANPRLYAHTMSDEILMKVSALGGVARTKLVFASDRDGGRLAGTVENRQGKELYVSDYDGENQRRATTGFFLNINAEWSPDARSIAFTTFRLGQPNIFVQHIYDGTPPDILTKEQGNNVLPAWSPDGSRIAFVSTRDGSSDIYVMNKDGSHVQRLTTNPAIDTSPTWSPDGHQIAFVSDRTGASHPELWIMEADGLSQRQITHEGYVDRPTWSSPPFNEIAFSTKTGPGFDVKILDLATRQSRIVTDGLGSNESPVFSPNGRHIAFMSSRAGKDQIFTINRMGQDLKQLTRTGNNQGPNWSTGPQVR